MRLPSRHPRSLPHLRRKRGQARSRSRAIKPPLAVHLSGVRVGRSEPALYTDAGVDGLGEAYELRLVHGTACILIQAPFESRLLDRTHGHRENNLVGPFLYLVADEDGPGIILQRLDKPPQPLLLDAEPSHKILGCQAADATPDLLVDLLSGLLSKPLCQVDEPERIHCPIVPEEELDVAAQLRCVHALEQFQVHLPARVASHRWNARMRLQS